MERLNELINGLCGIEAKPKDVEAINKVIDFLTTLRERENNK
jgi:hypothetical protein